MSDTAQQETIYKLGVIGDPVKHSLSPLIHNHWLARYGFKGDYGLMPCTPQILGQAVETMKAQGFAGFNVTLPHKQTIMEYCDTIDVKAQAVGAVNCVVIDKDGVLHGYNSDVYGFGENLENATKGRDFAAPLIVGAGGAARAALYYFVQKGCPNITIVNRTPEKAGLLAEEFKCNFVQWDEKDAAAKKSDVIVNTTSLGMLGMEALMFDREGLDKDTVFYDIVYTPMMTPFLREAKAAGHEIVGGIGMLYHQAAQAFELWSGVMPTVDEALALKMKDVLKS
jgi:shikimate dehydrogenase